MNSTNHENPEALDGSEHQDVRWQVPGGACRWLEVGHVSGEARRSPRRSGRRGVKCSSWSTAAGRAAKEMQAGVGEDAFHQVPSPCDANP